MDEEQATQIASALGGEAWNSGGDYWLVLFRRSDGKLVVISDEIICEYDDEGAFENNNPTATIILH